MMTATKTDRVLKERGLEVTIATLEKAYYSLVAAGLLSIDQAVFKKEEAERA